jgi:nitrate/nitrite transport system permease protein
MTSPDRRTSTVLEVTEASQESKTARPLPPVPEDPRLTASSPPGKPGWAAELSSSLALGLLGAGVLLAAWQAFATIRPDFPSPAATLTEFRTIMASPFHDLGPNDRGIFLLLSETLQKVFGGFLVAAVVGIPAGFAIGASRKAYKAANPQVQIFRPVSPLAWYPLALVLFKNPFGASILTIGITSLWPTLINTAAGVASVPQDHRNVARVFRFSRAKYLRRILLPYSLGSIMTGLRLSMGIGWMVIVATEMLSAAPGIGFFVWDRYNNGNLPAVVVAIFFIGVIGFLLDLGLKRLQQHFDYAAISR